jgi:hypothetical protein
VIPSLLKLSNDFPNQSSHYTIGLDSNESLFAGHIELIEMGCEKLKIFVIWNAFVRVIYEQKNCSDLPARGQF